jgi:rhomboid protease GluP
MKLMHYFITKQNYRPVVLHGTKDELWLENFKGEYQLIRICLKEIRNQEQYETDLHFVNRVSNNIKRSTFSFKVKTLNIYLYNHYLAKDFENIKTIVVDEQDKVEDNNPFTSMYKDFKDQVKKKGTETENYLKYANEINLKNEENASQSEILFKPKTPYVTYALIAINVLMFLLLEFHGYLLTGGLGGSTNLFQLIRFGAHYQPLIKGGEYYRLFSSLFLHIGVMHLLFNNYALYVLGKQIETFYGHLKFALIYFGGGLIANLLVFLFVPVVSAGASSALFGLFSAYLYFGYHNRVILGRIMKESIVPVLVLNLVLGFVIPNINVTAHIGGLIGGFVVSMAVGIRFKTVWYDRIAAIVGSIALIIGLFYIGVFVKPVTITDNDQEVNATMFYYYSEYLDDIEKALDFQRAILKSEERSNR